MEVLVYYLFLQEVCNFILINYDLQNIAIVYVDCIFISVKSIKKAAVWEVFKYFFKYSIYYFIVRNNYLKVLKLYILALSTSFDDLQLEILEMILKVVLTSCKSNWPSHVVTIFYYLWSVSSLCKIICDSNKTFIITVIIILTHRIHYSTFSLVAVIFLLPLYRFQFVKFHFFITFKVRF